jgi:uncharacterized membrane protein
MFSYEKNKWRIWEIDAFRGIAIILMVFYHSIWFLNYTGTINFPQVIHGAWLIFAHLIAAMFIFLVGISLTLSFSRIPKSVPYIKKFLKRGFEVFSLGVIITAVTYLLMKDVFIFFGILHFIGIGIMLAIPFLRFKKLNLLFGTVIILIGFCIYWIEVDFPWLVLFGFRFYGMHTLDYFPLLPWFGFILLGLFAGNALYPKGKRKISFPALPFRTVLCFLGRHSLVIYFLQVLLILGVIGVLRIM